MFRSPSVTAVSLPEDILRRLQEVTTQVLEEEAANDEDFARVYESQQAFQSQYRLWEDLGYLPSDM